MLLYAQTLNSLKTSSLPSESGSVVGGRASVERGLASVEPLGQSPLLSTKRQLLPSTGGMHQLTKLRFQAGEAQDHRGLAECLSSLTGLRSLTLFGSCRWTILPENDERRLMALTQLTELFLKHYQIGYGRRLPTGIQSLTCLFSWKAPGRLFRKLDVNDKSGIAVDSHSFRFRASLSPSECDTISIFARARKFEASVDA